MFLRKTLTACTTVGLLVASACGDDEQGGGFCGEFEKVSDEFEDRDASDPEVLREHMDALGELSPPEEIEADWDLLGERWEEFADVESVEDLEVDPTDLEAAQEFDQRSEEYRQALRNVRSYLRDECDLDLG